MKNTNIDDPVVGLTVEDPNIGLCIVTLEALKDKHYEKYKHLTQRQLTDLLYELGARRICGPFQRKEWRLLLKMVVFL